MDEETKKGLDPSIYKYEQTPSRKSVLSKKPRHELAPLLPTDWDVGVACILATLGTVPQASLHRFLTAVPSVSTGTGCDGFLSQVANRYGVSFDPSILFALNSEEALYRKMLERRNEVGIFRTLPLSGVTLDDEQQVRGLYSSWCLSSLGASALIAKSTREPSLKAREISFPTSKSGYALPTVIHNAQMATYLMALLMGFAEKAQKDSGIWDVVDVFGDGERWGTGGSSMFPDAVVKIICNGEPATIIIENDSGTMSEERLKSKAGNYLRYMLGGDAFTWARPWLLFLCPENKVAAHERAVLAAYRDNGLLTIGGGGVGRIAIATHEDVGMLGATGRIYGVFAPREEFLLPRKYDPRALVWKTVGGSSRLCGHTEAA